MALINDFDAGTRDMRDGQVANGSSGAQIGHGVGRGTEGNISDGG